MRFLPRHLTPRLGRGFTLMEMMIVMAIIAILAVGSIDLVASFEAGERGTRAAREALATFRFARGVAISTGKKTRVVVNSTTRTLSVQWNSSGDGATFVQYTTNMTGSGNFILNLSTTKELAGTTFSFTPLTPGYFEYSATGNCAQSGTMTFSYGGRAKVLTIPNVGDPRI